MTWKKGMFLMTLFSDSSNNACQAYLNLRDASNDHCRAGREHCEDLWRDFRDLADTNFLSEFPVHLHERWFEMYLTVALKRAGYNVQCTKPGPDILLTINECRIWIEATCASAGEAGLPDSVPVRPIPKFDEPPVVTSRPTNEMTLRITNRLDDKQKQFKNWIKDGIVVPTDVTVVAININGIPNAWPDINDLMPRALYGLGDIQLTIDHVASAVVDQGHTHRPTIMKAKTGEPVCLQYFANGSLPHISAVLGSWEAAVNLPRSLGDGLTLFPNVTATTLWPIGTIRLGEEWADKSGDRQLTKISYITMT